MKEIQTFLYEYQKEKNWHISDEDYDASKMALLHNYMLLMTEVGEVGEELRAIFKKVHNDSHKMGVDEDEAYQEAKELYKENLGKEIADCIAYLVKFANHFEIDLEKSFYDKMEEVNQRLVNQSS